MDQFTNTKHRDPPKIKLNMKELYKVKFKIYEIEELRIDFDETASLQKQVIPFHIVSRFDDNIEIGIKTKLLTSDRKNMSQYPLLNNERKNVQSTKIWSDTNRTACRQ